MANNYLITESYLKTTTSVSNQKDVQDIKKAFNIVEEFYLKDLLGLPLFEFYKAHANATSPPALDTIKGQLLSKVQLYFALMAEHEIMFDLFDISNKGNTVEQNAASIELVKLKRGEVLSKAQHVKKRILDYLREHQDSFTDYFPASPSTPPQRAEGFSPIVFDYQRKYYYGQ